MSGFASGGKHVVPVLIFGFDRRLSSMHFCILSLPCSGVYYNPTPNTYVRSYLIFMACIWQHKNVLVSYVCYMSVTLRLHSILKQYVYLHVGCS